jgi:hypothetical protein
MSLFPRHPLLYAIRIDATFVLGPGRVTLDHLEFYPEGTVLRFYAVGPDVFPPKIPFIENFTRLFESDSPEKSHEYIRMHSSECRDILRGLAPPYGETIDFTFADDIGTQYGFFSAGGGKADEGWDGDMDIQPPIPEGAKKFFITAHYTGRPWNDVDMDHPLDHTGEPTHSVVIDL